MIILRECVVAGIERKGKIIVTHMRAGGIFVTDMGKGRNTVTVENESVIPNNGK